MRPPPDSLPAPGGAGRPHPPEAAPAASLPDCRAAPCWNVRQQLSKSFASSVLRAAREACPAQATRRIYEGGCSHLRDGRSLVHRSRPQGLAVDQERSFELRRRRARRPRCDGRNRKRGGALQSPLRLRIALRDILSRMRRYPMAGWRICSQSSAGTAGNSKTRWGHYIQFSTSRHGLGCVGRPRRRRRLAKTHQVSSRWRGPEEGP